MKRYIRTAPVIFFAALALVGCSKAEDVQGNPDSALQIESVSGISPFALMQEPSTKAVIIGNTLTGSDAATGIGIFVTASSGGAYDGHANGYTNVKFSNSGSGWSTATPVYLSDTEGKLHGYFPYNADATDLRAIPVASSLGGTDYLYADSKTVSHTNKSVSLTMNHALSRLHLTIKKGANFTASAPLSKITLTSTAIDATGTMDLATGAVTASKKSGETGTVELTTDGTITAEGIEKDILLVPANNSEGKKGITIILTIDGKLASVTLTETSGLDIRSGIQNNLTLTVEDTGIKVTGVEIGGWGEGFSQQIEVNSHTVTVKPADGIPAGNVIFSVYVEGLSVKIIAYPINSRGLICQISGQASVDRIKDFRDIHTFTVSEIQSDITATIEYAPLPSGALNAVFTVDDDGNGNTKKVHFSQGNLYYDGNQFKFETNQYGYHTYDSDNNTWGLFGWSTNSTNYGMSTSKSDEDYSGNFKDWGNAIDGDTWETLTINQWKYLFSHHVCIWGFCNSVTGRFIAPDNFVGGTTALTNAVSDWESAQAAGIVFLPGESAHRTANTVVMTSYAGSGNYWSSDAQNNSYAFYMKISKNGTGYDEYISQNRHIGYFVRLVTDVK